VLFQCCLWLANMTVGQDLAPANSFLNKVNPSSEGTKVKASYSKHALKVTILFCCGLVL